MADMRAEPRLPLIIFGNGLQAQLLKIKEGIIADNGEKNTEVEFRPTRELMFYYDLATNDLNNQERLSFIRRYPSIYVWPLSRDPTNQTYLILCDFKGMDTQLTTLYATVLENNRTLQKMVSALRNENAVLHVNIKKATSRQGEYQKEVVDNLKEVLKLKSMPSFGDIQGMGGEQ
jgi:hypothetical protein